MCKYGWWSMLELAPAWRSDSTYVHVHSTSASVTIPRRQSRFWHYGCGSDLPTRYICHWLIETNSGKLRVLFSIIVLLMILVCVLRWCPEFSLFIGNVIKYEVYAKLIMNELEKLFKLHIVNTHEWKTGPMNEWLIHNKSCDILWLCLVFIWKRKPSDVERTLLNIHLSIWL